MKTITHKKFIKWLDAYGRASRDNDPAASADLFTSDACYYESPFTAPLVGREAIYEYWAGGALAFKDKISRYQVLAVNHNLGIARWQSDFTDVTTGERFSLDCIFLVDFDPDGRCRLFNEWWHQQESSG